MTRIVAGTLGGRRLAVPPGRVTRPTSDRVREGLFSTLDALAEVAGCRFADLYAGSGAVGLEAASRGAATVLLVESDARAARVAAANVAALDLGGVCRVVRAPAATVVAGGPDGPYDAVFADPPYAMAEDVVAALLAGLVGYGWLGPGAVVVVERSSRSPEPAWPDGVTADRRRRYGESVLWYGRRAWASTGGPPDVDATSEAGSGSEGRA
jgi:16S rRNA (guanine966-N2)-methyltransferase